MMDYTQRLYLLHFLFRHQVFETMETIIVIHEVTMTPRVRSGFLTTLAQALIWLELPFVFEPLGSRRWNLPVGTSLHPENRFPLWPRCFSLVYFGSIHGIMERSCLPMSSI